MVDIVNKASSLLSACSYPQKVPKLRDNHPNMDKNSNTKCSIPVFSRYHPVIPKLYTPEWKLDMKNRNLIVENCRLAKEAYGPHEISLYLEKRERLNNVEPRELVMTKSVKIPRDRLLHPYFHSPLSKFQSSLMSRTAS